MVLTVAEPVRLTEELRASIVAMYGEGKFAREIAAVVAFLCGPEAGYVNGASWAVDGGMLQMGPQAGSHLESHDWRRP